MSLASLTAFLVEDEPLCRADFRQTLRDFPEIRLLGEAETLRAAKSFLSQQTVDLLFLDISVGRENGLDLVETLPKKPLVIALTAHPQHAVRGFSLNLVDYILKPVEKERLRAALQKARQWKSTARQNPGRVTLIAEIAGEKTTLQMNEIMGAEAMGNYVLLHTTRGKAVKRSTFKKIQTKLLPSIFLETRRGRLISRQAVQSWCRNSSGKLVLNLTDQTRLVVSPSRAPKIIKFLEKE